MKARRLDHSESVRILLVTPGLGLGGSERLTLAYARGLLARGHDVLVVHGPPERFSDADVAGISRHRLSGRPTPRQFPDWLRSREYGALCGAVDEIAPQFYGNEWPRPGHRLP